MADTLEQRAMELLLAEVAPNSGVTADMLRDTSNGVVLTAAALRAIVAVLQQAQQPVRNPAFVGEWHAKAVSLGYDGVADMLDSVERGEPPQHIATALASAAGTKAQQPDAQAVAWRKVVRNYHEYEGSEKEDHVGYLTTKFLTEAPDIDAVEWQPLYTHPQPPSIPEPSDEDVVQVRSAFNLAVMRTPGTIDQIYNVAWKDALTTYTARLRERIGGGV